MANTLTGLIPTIYAGLNVVSRELIGMIPNVTRDSTTAGAAVGQTVRSPVAPQNTLEDIVPGNDPADSGDQTMEFFDVTITKSKAYPIRWSGEEQLSTTKDGVINNLLAQQFEQGFRTLANAVEVDLGGLYAQASRAYGTAGTTPFATADDHSDFAQINRILDENGAPMGMRSMVVGSAARANIEGKQSGLFKVNEAGDAGALLRDRQMRSLHGFTMGTSAGIAAHTAGTMTGALVNNGSNEAVGETTITYDGGTPGATGFVAGDIVTFAGDANKYVVATGNGGASGDVVLQENGLLIEAADDTAITVGAGYTANLAFSQDAFLLATRAPAMPDGGDEADDVMTVTDPVSGLTFQVALYRQYRRIKYEIGLAWGVAAPNPRHSAILLG